VIKISVNIKEVTVKHYIIGSLTTSEMRFFINFLNLCSRMHTKDLENVADTNGLPYFETSTLEGKDIAKKILEESKDCELFNL